MASVASTPNSSIERERNLRVALVHDFLNQYGGAERVLEAIYEIYPHSDVYTSLYDPNKIPLRMRKWDVRAFRLPALGGPFAKAYTLFYPMLFEGLDLSDYDLVISSTANFAKGVLTKPDTLHISYIHTPPRFLYHYPTELDRRGLGLLRSATAPLDNYLRVWDYHAAQRPDFLVTNSRETAARIRKFYGREATVIYPPVSLEDAPAGETPGVSSSTPGVKDLPAGEAGAGSGYFLVVSRLASYKKIDLAIEACNRLGLPLKIVGTGREEKRLKRIAGPTVEFLGFVRDERLPELYQNCRALIFPGMEDFGITPIEAMAHGKPVIALGKGGALETVVDTSTPQLRSGLPPASSGATGTFFEQETPESLMNVLKTFDPSKYKARDCTAQAKKFSKERFQKEFKGFVDRKLNEKRTLKERAFAG